METELFYKPSYSGCQ